jgi:hypothetical protein
MARRAAPRPPSVKDDRTAVLRPKLLAVMRALAATHPSWTQRELMDATRARAMAPTDYQAALRTLTRQGKVLHDAGLPGCPSVYRLPPAESSPP